MNERDSAAWDLEAQVFDQQPDHGLQDLAARGAWRELLATYMPDAPCDVGDLGCGTGTLAVLLAEEGYRVHGMDFSTEMLSRAAQKADAAGVQVALTHADVSEPPLAAGIFDVVLSRHVLWALPDAARALRQWSRLLRPGGRLVLVEGHWSTGAGLRASVVRDLLAELGGSVEIQSLSDPLLWGGSIHDDRYLATSVPAGPQEF